MASKQKPKPPDQNSHDATATTITSTTNDNGSSSSPTMIRGASLLIALQLLSRLATFAANQLLLRLLTAPLLGLAAQLDVYYLSVLFFARESLRVAVQRQGVKTETQAPSSSTKKDKYSKNEATSRVSSPEAIESQAVINLGYLSLLLGLILTPLLATLYLSSATSSTLSAPYLVPSLRIYGVAALLELLSEPCFVLMQTRLKFGTRAAAESVATVVRCGVVFGTALYAARSKRSGDGLDLGVLPFALGQVSYGLSLLTVYFIASHRLASTSTYSLLPRRISSPSTSNNDKADNAKTQFVLSYFYRPTLTLASSMMAQSIVKHLLTQGDTFLVSMLSSPEVQGVYALVANYGGLLARLLFQPVEESSRSYFSRLLSAADTTDATVSKEKDASAVSKGKGTDKAEDQVSAPVAEAKRSLQTLLRLYILLSTIIISLGPPASTPLLTLIAGKQWISAGAGTTLSAYCFYIPLLALNGITESFVASVATEGQVHRQSIWMGGFSVVFAASAFVFMRVLDLGARGLVVANGVNMLCRVVWSWWFIGGWFGNRGVGFEVAEVVPGGALAAGVSTLVMLWQLDVHAEAVSRPFTTLVKVAGSAIPLVLLIAFLERRFLLECVQSIRGRSGKQ